MENFVDRTIEKMGDGNVIDNSKEVSVDKNTEDFVQKKESEPKTEEVDINKTWGDIKSGKEFVIKEKVTLGETTFSEGERIKIRKKNKNILIIKILENRNNPKRIIEFDKSILLDRENLEKIRDTFYMEELSTEENPEPVSNEEIKEEKPTEELASEIVSETDKEKKEIENIATKKIEDQKDSEPIKKVETEKENRGELEEKLLQVDKLLSLYKDRDRFLFHLENLKKSDNTNKNELANAQTKISELNYDLKNLGKKITKSDIEGFPENERRKVEEIMNAIEEGKMDYGKLVVREKNEVETVKTEPEPQAEEIIEPESVESVIEVVAEQKEPQTIRGIIEDLELLEEYEMYKGIYNEKSRKKAEMKKEQNRKEKAGEEISEEEKREYDRISEEVQRAKIDVDGAEIGALYQYEVAPENKKAERWIIDRKVELTTLLVKNYEVLEKMKRVEDKNVEKLNPKKQRAAKRFVSAVVDKIQKQPTVDKSKNQQTGEPKKGGIKELWRKVFGNRDEEETETEEEVETEEETETTEEREKREKFKNDVAIEFLRIIEEPEEIDEFLESEKLKGDESINIKKPEWVKEAAKNLSDEYGDDKGKLGEEIKKLKFTKKDFEKARKELEAETTEGASETEVLETEEVSEEIKEKIKKALKEEKDEDEKFIRESFIEIEGYSKREVLSFWIRGPIYDFFQKNKEIFEGITVGQMAKILEEKEEDEETEEIAEEMGEKKETSENLGDKRKEAGELLKKELNEFELIRLMDDVGEAIHFSSSSSNPKVENLYEILQKSGFDLGSKIVFEKVERMESVKKLELQDLKNILVEIGPDWREKRKDLVKNIKNYIVKNLKSSEIKFLLKTARERGSDYLPFEHFVEEVIKEKKMDKLSGLRKYYEDAGYLKLAVIDIIEIAKNK